MIKKISPRMHKALRDGKPLHYFADVWLSVLNDKIDSQADFEASKLQSNMDFTTKPGYALLAKQAETIQQLSQNTNKGLSLSYGPEQAWQSFKIIGGRWINQITLYMGNSSGAGTTFGLTLWSMDQSAQVASASAYYAGVSSGPLAFTFTDIFLDAGTYWWKAISLDSNYGMIWHQNADVYADGQGDYYHDGWTYNIGDYYFKLDMQKYQPSGSFRTARLDLGETPRDTGTFQMAYSHPADTQLQVDLYGYAAESDTSPAVTLLDVDDGQSVPSYQFWEIENYHASNAVLDQTPQIDMMEFLFPKESLKLREKDKALRNVGDDILSEYRALLTGTDYKSSDIKILERVASGGELSATLEDATGETIMRVVSDSPLKNYRAILYIGADVPGFVESDLLRFFIGTVQAAEYIPKYRRAFSSLNLTFKNPILELKRKIPQPAETGAVTLADISINYDKTHVMDAMLDSARGEADIPARYLDIEQLIHLRSTIGDASLPAAAIIVRRSNAAGLPDNRIKNPDEVGKFWAQLATIADVYVTEDEDSRITAVKHDKYAPAEAVWAHEDLVKDGIDAIPIEDVAKIDLGYNSLLFNAAMMGCEWSGDGSDWTALSKVFANVNSDSVEEFAPGKAVYLSIMEKNLKEASQWLGPENGYNGEAIAQALAARYVARFAWPPVVMTGVVVPNSQFMLTKGAVVQVWDPEFAKFKRRGIALSEILKFMVISKKPDRGRNRMVFSLLELT
jgi:hypothetical protein